MELTEYITDLLIDFDEMGFAPTTLVPNPEAYAIEWRNKITKAFKELTEDNEYLKTQLTATESRYESRKESDIAEMLELRLYVEELTEENERLRAENARYEAENHAEFNKWLKLEEATKRHHC